MSDTLLHAYGPLIFWTGLGLLSCSLLPDSLPRVLGRGLYWVGVPVQIFTLARQTDFSSQVGLAPLVVVLALLGGLGIAWGTLQGLHWLELGRSPRNPLTANPPTVIPSVYDSSNFSMSAPTPTATPALDEPVAACPVEPSWEDSTRRGSFLVSAVLGNTGFVGLAIAPSLISEPYLGWLVFYSVTQNVVGTYGLGVWLASIYGRSHGGKAWWVHLRDVLTVPSLWAFGLGMLTRTIALPSGVDAVLHGALWWVIIPAALLLMGLRLRQIHGWRSLKGAIAPALLKVMVLPVGVAGLATLLGLSAEPRLALVLMSGMPTAFAGLILAEEYDLDRELIASSIVLTTAMLLFTIPVWLLLR
ncbi:AEC family transporter [Thermoleptolyngbya sp. C42_A2020_037]|uniref:AEC family transporter n=1 Tax=Thermoleptolyngbya sp. C42_A2020_037 TaxID=2747799 RepID=UPI0019FCE603|nr:AEC family transporter [Thermoleptolyngbya sp. C42_A2020_037]MBF2087080.1 AEC family transporter [Thermoleptolyngbya sp. C42_A2020_037]